MNLSVAAQARESLSRIHQTPSEGGVTTTSSSKPANSHLSPISASAASSQRYLTGVFQGYVNSSGAGGAGISGVSVQAYINGGSGSGTCPMNVCSPSTSNATGYFSLNCPTGVDYITFTAAWYAENLSYQTCQTNQTVWVGTVYLLPDGIVTGKVVADDPAHQAVPGVTVTGSTRDSVLVASPVVTTATNGSFTVPVPPNAASMLTFTPGSNFNSNFTDVYAAAGQTVNVGTVYLEPLVVVQAKLYNAITGAPIDGSYFMPDSLTVCSLISGTCYGQGPPTTSGNVVQALGPTGYDYVLAEAVGYLENQTDVGFVTSGGPGTTYCVPSNCRINLVPEAYIQVTVNLNTPSKYSSGLWYASVSSMDGEEIGIPVQVFNPTTFSFTYNTSVASTLEGGCVSPGSTVTIPAFPLRNDIKILPDTTGVCGNTPQWPIPGDAPVYSNETWANATPGMVTNVGVVNLIVGDYIFGTVGAVGGNATVPSGFSVTVASREASSVAVYSFTKGTSPQVCGPNYDYTFCVPAPPGPDTLTVSALGYPSNNTWVSVPWGGFNNSNQPLTLWNATLDHINMINLTGMSVATGDVAIVGGTEGIAFASVEICPAATHAAISQCADGVANDTGGFNISAVPVGWDAITVSASGFRSNSVWQYFLPGLITNVGVIPLTPLAILWGQVVGSNGTGLIDVSVSYCTIASWSHGGACNNLLGSGLTTSNGIYEGYLPGGWLPGATYTIMAQSSGYLSDWTLVNATANATVRAPTLVLPQIGSNTRGPSTPVTRSLHSPPASASVTGSWVTGRIVDATTGQGVSTSAIQACSAGNLTCVLFSPGSNSGGYFNSSVASGTYNLTISPSGYYPVTILLAATSGNSLDLGTISLTPLQWVSGRVFINPWNVIEVQNPSSRVNVSLLLGPPSTVKVCNSSQTVCTTSMPVNSAGMFSVQTILGDYLDLSVNPAFAGGFTSGPGGFVRNSTIFNATSAQTNLTNPIPLDIFLAYSVTAYNNASYNATTGQFSQPALWTSVTLSSRAGSGRNGAASGITNGAGQIVLFLAAGPARTLSLAVGNPNMFFQASERNAVSLSLATPNLTYVYSPINLTPFGWAVATVVNSLTGLPAIGVGMSATITTQTGVFTTSGSANAAGYVNISAPPGKSVRFSIGGTDDYNNTTLYAAVVSDTTTYLNSTNVSGAIVVDPWGWVRSSELNFSVPVSYIGTVVDPVHNGAVDGASVSVESSDPSLGISTGLGSNGLGEFMVDAPIGRADYLQVSAEGYVTNTTAHFSVRPGGMVVFSTINLTGDGVLAGMVIASPSGLPIPGATVSVCPANTTFSPECVSVTTNLSGLYWAATPPGRVAITVTALNFIGNYTEDVVVRSDAYFMAPTYVMQEYGLVSGSVVGLPIGLSLPNATVSLCSPLGIPTGPCAFQYETTSNGSFAISVPAGQYVVTISYPFYNSTYLPISLKAGEVLTLGSLFVQEYGILLGKVLNSITHAPVSDAIVSACPVLLWMSCDVPVRTTASGSFRLAASSGRVDVSVAAQGYQTGFAKLQAKSGASESVAPIFLLPIGQYVTYSVSGVVSTTNASGTAGIGGATVTFLVGNVTAYSTLTDSLGRYQAQVLSGQYRVEFSKPGFLAASVMVDVSGPLHSLDATLSVFTYVVTGQTIDGLTQASLANVSIAALGLNGSSTTSGPAGEFTLSLPNGTYEFRAVVVDLNASSVYAPTVFQIVVSGSSINRTIRLFPPVASLQFFVHSGSSPLPNASVVVYGTAADGASLSYAVRTDALGRASFTVYYGNYTVISEAVGYYSTSQPVSIQQASMALSMNLPPVPAPSTSDSGVWIAATLWVSAAAIGILGVFVWGRRA